MPGNYIPIYSERMETHSTLRPILPCLFPFTRSFQEPRDEFSLIRQSFS